MSNFLEKLGRNRDTADVSREIEQLHRFLHVDLAHHIRKEEDVLFPAVQEACTDLAGAVEEMLDEHRRIETQRDGILAALQRLEGDHDLVHGAIADARAALPSGGTVPLDLETLRLQIERLSWLLQGHFTGEEDEIFLPAEEILTPEELASLTETMALIEASAPTGTTG